jgi:hypothetical protein
MQMFSLQGIRSADGVTEVLGVFEDGHDTSQRIGAFIAQLPAGMYHTITSTEHSPCHHRATPCPYLRTDRSYFSHRSERSAGPDLGERVSYAC